MIANLYLYQFAIGYWQTLFIFYQNNVGPSVKTCIQIVLFDTVLLVSLYKDNQLIHITQASHVI